ncbi:unnamed protein product [Linum trigynum]|uniref:Uncharacterized protein n=1 Tax=Linum trigynum TaxID=586398 RepID=A0AAV2E0Q9_9ROSI
MDEAHIWLQEAISVWSPASPEFGCELSRIHEPCYFLLNGGNSKPLNYVNGAVAAEEEFPVMESAVSHYLHRGDKGRLQVFPIKRSITKIDPENLEPLSTPEIDDEDGRARKQCFGAGEVEARIYQ